MDSLKLDENGLPIISDERRRLGEYCPFIADVPFEINSEPFTNMFRDNRDEQEIEEIRKQVRPLMNNKNFKEPIPLADYCLVVRERWREKEQKEMSASK